MAISLLDSGSSGAVDTTSNTTVAVDVTTGNGNRKLLIGISLEGSGTSESTVTFNGQELVALGLEVPDTEEAPDGFARTVFYEQFEGGMPADGTSNIVVTWSNTSGGALVSFWLVDGVRQDQLATGAGNNALGGGGAATTISTSVTAGDTGAFLASVVYKNDPNGGLSFSAPASTTEIADVDVTGGARCGAGHKLGSLTAGSNTVTWTFDSENRRAVSAVVVNPVTFAELSATADFASGPASASASAEAAHQASASFTSGAATASASAESAHQAAASFTSGAASMATTASVEQPPEIGVASFVSGPASASAAAERGFAELPSIVAIFIGQGDAAVPVNGVEPGDLLLASPFSESGANIFNLAPAGFTLVQGFIHNGSFGDPDNQIVWLLARRMCDGTETEVTPASANTSGMVVLLIRGASSHIAEITRNNSTFGPANMFPGGSLVPFILMRRTSVAGGVTTPAEYEQLLAADVGEDSALVVCEDRNTEAAFREELPVVFENNFGNFSWQIIVRPMRIPVAAFVSGPASMAAAAQASAVQVGQAAFVSGSASMLAELAVRQVPGSVRVTVAAPSAGSSVIAPGSTVDVSSPGATATVVPR